MHLSSQENHPGWLSEPIRFRNQSSLTAPFLNSPAGPDVNWQACWLPCGRGTSGLRGRAGLEPRPLAPA